MLIKKQYGDNSEKLVSCVRDFNSSITENKDDAYSEIDAVKKMINRKTMETLGNNLAQSVNLQFSETTFNKIIENIRMLFFPHSGETDISKFRDLATNSLGYNNLLYIATVFSELELIKDSDVFTVLLIEEPEAHLHPQLQVKFIKYLQELSLLLKNAQIIVSSHSSVLASSVNIDRIVHIADCNGYIEASTMSGKVFGDDLSAKYINRWMDVTKSTMLFSRGIILVEGISEALLMSRFGEIVLAEYNKTAIEKRKPLLANSLEEMGVSVININGINFKHFMKLFGNFNDSSGPCIPIFCAGITDRDPAIDCFPQKGKTPESANPVNEIIDSINENDFTRLFMSPLKTFEYELGMENTVTLASALRDIWPNKDGSVVKRLDGIIAKGSKCDSPVELVDDAKYIYEHIESSSIGKGVFAHTLSELIDSSFIVPHYIKNAVLWACGGVVDE
jgi:predicted ATP-dependent endonuclease of OLD family